MNDGVTKSRQSNNNVRGDQAGRDVNKTTNIILGRSSGMDALRNKIEKLTEDCLYDPNFADCIKELTHYLNPIDPHDQRNLKTKLTEAGRADEVQEAEELKEYFAKILVKNNLSQKAQEVYVHILSVIKVSYDNKVKPLIKENPTHPDIGEKVFEIIDAIYSTLSESVLKYDMRQVKGMLYFLTGNCHIDWKY